MMAFDKNPPPPGDEYEEIREQVSSEKFSLADLIDTFIPRLLTFPDENLPSHTSCSCGILAVRYWNSFFRYDVFYIALIS